MKRKKNRDGDVTDSILTTTKTQSKLTKFFQLYRHGNSTPLSHPNFVDVSWNPRAVNPLTVQRQETSSLPPPDDNGDDNEDDE